LGGLQVHALAGPESTMQVRAILVAVADPIARVQPALERAADIAVPFKSRIVLFHAAFDSALSGRPFFDSKRLAKSRGWYIDVRTRALEAHAAKLRRLGLQLDVSVTWEEPAHEAIVRAALREGADLVIAGRHERRKNSPQPRLTDWELMRLCPRPLLVTRSSSVVARSGAVLAALDPQHLNDKPATLDIAIAQHATAFAQALRLDCHAAHFVPSSAYPLGESAAGRRKVQHRIAMRMKRVMKRAGAAAAPVHVLQGDVVADLPTLTRKLGAQILVMGIISRRGVKRLVIGDTAESIIRAASCDILLIKPDGFRLRLGKSRKESVILPSK
jgi:universal stress protein E